MSYEWIKMRGDLWQNPKFLSLVNHLIFWQEDDNDPHGIYGYTCQADAICTDVYGSNPNETVTDKALRLVTVPALRDVTMCALLRVWHAVNKFAKVVGEDAVCSPMCVLDLDAIAGFEGFGNAMVEVGWAEKVEDGKALLFKNFCEFNEPASLRTRQPKTPAERQADWRSRQKQKAPAKAPVTKVTKSNAREEKRREEKNTKNPPTPLRGEIPPPSQSDPEPPPTPEPEPSHAKPCQPEPSPEPLGEPDEEAACAQDQATATAVEAMSPEAELAHAWTTARQGVGWRVPSGETYAELMGFFAEKIRLGKDPQFLLARIADPGRDRTEKLWQFARRELEAQPANSRREKYQSSEEILAQQMQDPIQKRVLEIAFNGYHN